MHVENPGKRARTRCKLAILSLLGAYSLHAQPSDSLLLEPAASAFPQKFERIGVCFQNERMVGKGSLKFTIDSLRRYEKKLRADFDFSCASPNHVLITFRESPADGLVADALGAARLRGDRILPEIQIFRASVRRLIGLVPPHIEGRAFAMIAAHELHHYLVQQAEHTSTGLNGEFFTARDLMRGFE